MACNSPLHGYRGPGGVVTLDRGVGFIDRPVPIACGQCLGCRMQRASDWTVRALHEEQMTWQLERRPSSFITLTYDDAHLPTDYGLHVSDWQRFAKRLRKAVGPFRFLHVGEYGEQTKRPHYHALIFGHDFCSDRVKIGSNQRGDPHFFSPTLTRVWGMGHTIVGMFSRESAAYVARYALKKVTGPAQDFAYLRERGEHYWWVKPEYLTMSLKPGLGERWFRHYAPDVYPSDETVIEGRKVHTPKYYDKLFERVAPELVDQLKAQRAARGRLRKADTTPDRLEAREAILRAKQIRRAN